MIGFILDADERVNESLKEEILKLKKEKTTYDAFWIPRQNHFMGRKFVFQVGKEIKLFDYYAKKYVNMKIKRFMLK